MNIKKLISISLQLIIYFLILLLLLLSPLPLGSVKEWSSVYLQVGSFLLFFAYILLQILDNSNDNWRKINNKKEFYLLILFIFICLLQIIPIPGFVLKLVSANSYEIWNTNFEILESLGFKGSSGYYTISLYPYITWKKLILILSYFAFAYTVSKFFKSRKQLIFIFLTIIVILFVESIIGTLQYTINKVTVSEIEEYGRIATGTYFNKNHYAGFLEITIPLLISGLFYYGGFFRITTFKEIKEVLSSQNLPKVILLLFVIILATLSLFFSLSRMGILSFGVAIFLFYSISKGLNKRGKYNWILIIGGSVLVLLIGIIGILPVIINFYKVGVDLPNRMLLWNDTISIIKDYPLFGTGLGTFEYVFQAFRTILRPIVYRYAHNDYLQLIFETGLIGSTAIFLSLIFFLRSSLRNIQYLYINKMDFELFICLGSLTGILSLLIHSLADFNLHIPANGLYFALLIALVKSTYKLQNNGTQSKFIKTKKSFNP